MSIADIPIGGLHKQSLIDYPGNISAVVFTCSCNFRCRYCHNPELVYPGLISKISKIKTTDFFEWMNKNKEILDAVVITGGEPTLHPALPLFIRKIKDSGLKVKLDTNGTNPEMIEMLILNKEIDYIAMDIKSSLSIEKYRTIVGNRFSLSMMDKVIQSIDIINAGKIAYEFRTTLDSSISKADIISITDHIKGDYYIQPQRKYGITITPDYSMELIEDLQNAKAGINIRVR